MDVIVFTTVDGHEVAIPEDDIQALWRSTDGNGTLIERLSDNPAIHVDYDFDELLQNLFYRVDLRLKKPIKAKKRTTKKAKNIATSKVAKLPIRKRKR